MFVCSLLKSNQQLCISDLELESIITLIIHGQEHANLSANTYPFQSQKSRSWGSFSRLEVSTGSINQASAKFKTRLVQLNYSSAHHNIIILSIEDRVHCWLKPPHKCTQTTLTCSVHPYIYIL